MQRILLLLGALIVSACAGNVSPPAAPSSSTPVAARVAARVPAANATRQGSYDYGRFHVTVHADGSQSIAGAQFVPPETPAVHVVNTTARHLIVVNVITKELHYYHRGQGDEWVANIGYAVLTPLPTALPELVVMGRVRQIVERPSWGPPDSIRRAYAAAGRPLPTHLSYGHRDNMMGEATFHIDWRNVRGWNLVRLHGARGYPQGNFWEADTFGCVALLDEALLTLLDRMGGSRRAVSEGIVVAFHRRLTGS